MFLLVPVAPTLTLAPPPSMVLETLAWARRSHSTCLVHRRRARRSRETAIRVKRLGRRPCGTALEIATAVVEAVREGGVSTFCLVNRLLRNKEYMCRVWDRGDAMCAHNPDETGECAGVEQTVVHPKHGTGC